MSLFFNLNDKKTALYFSENPKKVPPPISQAGSYKKIVYRSPVVLQLLFPTFSRIPTKKNKITLTIYNFISQNCIQCLVRKRIYFDITVLLLYFRKIPITRDYPL